MSNWSVPCWLAYLLAPDGCAEQAEQLCLHICMRIRCWPHHGLLSAITMLY